MSAMSSRVVTRLSRSVIQSQSVLPLTVASRSLHRSSTVSAYGAAMPAPHEHADDHDDHHYPTRIEIAKDVWVDLEPPANAPQTHYPEGFLRLFWSDAQAREIVRQRLHSRIHHEHGKVFHIPEGGYPGNTALWLLLFVSTVSSGAVFAAVNYQQIKGGYWYKKKTEE